MSLTHTQVRALISMIDDLSVPYAGGFTPHHDTARALAEEWLAARTVRWQGAALVSRAEPLAIGHTEGAGLGRRRGVFYLRGVSCVSLPGTEAEARAWLEAKAREAGHEIERGS